MLRPYWNRVGQTLPIYVSGFTHTTAPSPLWFSGFFLQGRTLVIMTPIETCVKTSNFTKFPLINRIVELLSFDLLHDTVSFDTFWHTLTNLDGMCSYKEGKYNSYKLGGGGCRVMMEGRGGQESVNQKFTFRFYSNTGRIKVIQTQTRVYGTAYWRERTVYTAVCSAIPELCSYSLKKHNKIQLHTRSVNLFHP